MINKKVMYIDSLILAGWRIHKDHFRWSDHCLVWVSPRREDFGTDSILDVPDAMFQNAIDNGDIDVR